MADAAPRPMPLPEDVAALRQRVAQLEAALTAQQHGEPALRDAKDAAEQIVETVREPLLVLTPDFRVQSANPAFYQLFQVRPAETIGQLIYQLGNGIYPNSTPCWNRFCRSRWSSTTMKSAMTLSGLARARCC